MAGLFRPWAEMLKNGVVKTEMVSGGGGQQDSTVSTTTTVKSEPEDRETKYKSVKEHVRIRTEKYLHKRMKDVGRKAGGRPSREAVLPQDSLPAVGPPTCFLPSSCCPQAVGGLLPIEEFSPDLLDMALAQGLPPPLVEEYARLLTEQQRHVTERNRKQRPKKFRCPHCQVGFSNNGQLKGHIRIHTGERPFKCDAESCGKSFTRNEELTRHRRIHSGLRPFPCPECGKRFGRKDHLKKHVRTHFQQRYQLVPILPLSSYPYLYGF